jgi:DNA-binding CsgD family transcriptional regulator
MTTISHEEALKRRLAKSLFINDKLSPEEIASYIEESEFTTKTYLYQFGLISEKPLRRSTKTQKKKIYKSKKKDSTFKKEEEVDEKKGKIKEVFDEFLKEGRPIKASKIRDEVKARWGLAIKGGTLYKAVNDLKKSNNIKSFKEEVEDKYTYVIQERSKGRSYNDIAKELGVDAPSISAVTRRKAGIIKPDRKCGFCKKDITHLNFNAKYCNTDCRNKSGYLRKGLRG